MRAQPQQPQTIDAAALISHLMTLMADIIKIVERETELVRAGKLTEAVKLEAAKTALSQDYLVTASLLKDGKSLVAKLPPARLDDLRRSHAEFHTLLQVNLTVLATAHAVSEGIMRGVQSELNRKSSPQTYGASGHHSSPSASAAQPLAVSRVL